MSLDLKYTLSNVEYRAGISASAKTDGLFFDASHPLIIGGAAVQLNIQDNPEYFRPTTDIDVIFNRFSRKSERKNWANEVAKNLMESGFNAEGKLTKHGSEARLTNVSPDLIVHLDCTNRAYFEKHAKRFSEEYERANYAEVNGINVRFTSPQDIIINKLNRVATLLNYGEAQLGSAQGETYHSLVNADIDSVVLPDFNSQLPLLLETRKKNIEDLARMNFDEVRSAIANYKIDKDFFDIYLMIMCVRNKKDNFDKREFLKNLSFFKEE